MMDLSTVARLERSFDAMAGRGHLLADRFFDVLFTENPHLRPKFPLNLAAHKQRFAESITALVNCLRRGSEDCPRPGQAMDTGRYDLIVRETLLDVMAEMSGTTWTPQLHRAWRRALEHAPVEAIAADAGAQWSRPGPGGR